MNRVKEFCNKIHLLSTSRSQHEVFVDFCELSALSLRQPFEKSPENEQRYHEILKRYPEKAAIAFADLLGIVVLALEEQPRDFLGECYHALELHNQYKGQFFTPYHVSMAMAEIALQGIEDHIKVKGYVTLNEPCCGSGAMVIAAYEILKKRNINPTSSMWVVAQDIDHKCCCMAYIQMTLLAIPGVVIWGDTLILENREQWLTSGFYLYPWSFRLKKEIKQKEESVHLEEKQSEVFGQLEFDL